AVRASLQSLEVKQLRVSSPSSWPRPAQGGQPAAVQATLQLSGSLEPSRLQPLIRGVGALAGVQLAPVRTEADASDDERVRQELLQLAYQDALRQARPLAALIGSRDLKPLEIRADGVDMPPIAMRAMAADAIAPFNPQELEPPKDRLGLQVRFCAQ
ncbi:MAG: SIMPL domain-containing protein, partial [Synechococcus sp. ELA057]